LEQALIHQLKQLEFSQEEKDYFRAKVVSMKQDWTTQRHQARVALQLRSDRLQDRQDRLTDAYLDKLIDRETFEQRKTALITERCLLNENLKNVTTEAASVPDRLSQFLELAGSAYLAYKLGLPEEKPQLMKILTSNRSVDRKLPMFVLASPFNEVAKRFESSCGSPSGEITLVWDALLPRLLQTLSAVPLAA